MRAVELHSLGEAFHGALIVRGVEELVALLHLSIYRKMTRCAITHPFCCSFGVQFGWHVYRSGDGGQQMCLDGVAAQETVLKNTSFQNMPKYSESYPNPTGCVRRACARLGHSLEVFANSGRRGDERALQSVLSCMLQSRQAQSRKRKMRGWVLHVCSSVTAVRPSASADKQPSPFHVALLLLPGP